MLQPSSEASTTALTHSRTVTSKSGQILLVVRSTQKSRNTGAGAGSNSWLMPPGSVKYHHEKRMRTSTPSWTSRCGSFDLLMSSLRLCAHVHRLADLVAQQLVELVAQIRELIRGHEIAFARMRLLDLDNLLDLAGTRRQHRHAVGEEHGFDEAMGDDDDRFAGGREEHREVLA